ncbi:MAG: hypothetical protein AAGA16_25370, partial [Cyanobacteria bacterium P01_E01_bin.35]
MSRQHEFVQQILTLESDRLDNLLENNITCLNNDLLNLIEETQKVYKKPYCVDWAKLQMALASIHLNYDEYISYEDSKKNVREKGINFCNNALNVYQREKCDREIAICQTYLDVAYDKCVYNLRQYAGIVPEEESVIQAIEANKIAAAYFSLGDEYTYSDVVVEVIATAARYSHQKKPKSFIEKRKWREAYRHLHTIVQPLINRWYRQHEEYHNFLGKALSRNQLIRLVPQPKHSISHSLKSFLLGKGRISYLYKIDDKKEERERKYNGGLLETSLDAPAYKDSDSNINLVDTIKFTESTPWEKLIKKDDIERNNSLSYHITKNAKTDPEGRLKDCHPEGYPQANCQAMFYRKFINPPGDTLKVLAEEWGVPEGTLNSYYARGNYHKLLQEIVIEKELKYNLSPKASEYIRQDRSNMLKKCCLK